jgi:hypothetical protein
MLLGGKDATDEGKEATIAGLEKVVADFLVSSAATVMVFQLALALTHRITLSYEEAVTAMGGEFV